MKLKTRIILTYSYITILFICLIIIIINVVLRKEFEKYVQLRYHNDVSLILEQVIAQRKTTNSFFQISEEARAKGYHIIVYSEKGFIIFYGRELNNDNIIDKTYEITDGKKSYGQLVIGTINQFNFTQSDYHYLNTINMVLLISGSVFVIVSILVSFLIALKISTPIKAIQEQTRKIENGIFLDNSPKSDIREIKELSNSIKHLSVKLKEQENIKKRLASDYAHELKTPLTSLLTNLEGMIDNVIEISGDKLNMLRNEVLRLNRLVEQVNDIVLLKETNFEYTYFSLDKLLKDCIATYELRIKNKDLELITNINPVNIYASKDKLAQVILNLLSNALKYTNTGFIEINLYTKKKLVYLEVIDSGIGIEEEAIPFIFDNLYRSEASRSKDIDGFGIGLSIVYEIVKAHDGNITVESQIEVGSKFIITLNKK